ncbi:MAG: hypothetical protein H8D67_31045 [Deltaproteobacteria bacterium]|nr:hypothetical protein [Deltaproteobacteria bacterium]
MMFNVKLAGSEEARRVNLGACIEGVREPFTFPAFHRKKAGEWAIRLIILDGGYHIDVWVDDFNITVEKLANKLRCGEYVLASTPRGKVVKAAQFACSPEGHKRSSGAMRELKKAVAAYNEAQASG